MSDSGTVSEALIAGTNNLLHVVMSSLSSIYVARVDLPVAKEMKVLGYVLHQHLDIQ